jgi:hypothetical protein
VTVPGAGTPAPGSVEDDRIQEDGRTPSSWGLWVAVAFLTSGAFAAGLLVGVVADGNAEIMRDFRERSPNKVATSQVQAPPSDAPSPKPSAAANPESERRRNNQVDWAITIAPGTNVAPVDVRTADLEADSKVEFGMVYGSQVSPVATLWVQAASSAKIVLPIGRYSVRTTRMPIEPREGEAGSEPVVVDGAMDIARESEDTIPASLAGNRTGTWRITPATSRVSERPVRTKAKRSPRTRDFEYEGLGEGSHTGGTSTYDD